MSSEFYVEIGIESHTRLVTSREYWKAQAEQCELAAQKSATEWDAMVTATGENYNALRVALHAALQIEGQQLSDEDLVELIGARTMDRPPVSLTDQIVEWPSAEVRSSGAHLAELLREENAASSIVVQPEPRTESMRPIEQPIVVFDRPILAAPCDVGPWRAGDTVEVLNDDWHVCVELVMPYAAADDDAENADLWHADIQTIDVNYGNPCLRPSLGTRILLHENDTARNRLDERAEVEQLADAQGAAQ